MSTGKWMITKRSANRPLVDAKWSVETYPWLLIYPNGATCLCFNHKDAVDIIKIDQRRLRYEHSNFERMKRKFLAGSARARLVVDK